MEFVLAAMVLAAIVVFVITAPLRRAGDERRTAEERRAALEAAKELKYRDIRDAELDYRMGKLSEPDWRAADRELRSQAMEILRELDALGEDGAPRDEALGGRDEPVADGGEPVGERDEPQGERDEAQDGARES